MRIQILDLAAEDLVVGFHYYQAKEPGLGFHFLTNLYRDIERLQITGGTHPKAYRDYHRALSKRFPFAIYYAGRA